MKKVLRYFIIFLILGLFVGTIVYLAYKAKKKPTIYETKTPFKSNIIKKTVVTGSIVPRKEVEIKPRVTGIVDEIYIEPGQNVKKGDLIAKVQIIPDVVTLNNAEARLNKAQVRFDEAKIEYERQKKIFEQGVIPESEYQQYRLEYNDAKIELESAKNNVELIKEGVVKKAGNVTNTLIRSTIEGMVLDVPVEEGKSVIESNTFNEGTTIAVIANMGEMIFEGNIDETEVGKIKEGMDLLVTIGALENVNFDAQLEYVAPKGVEVNGAIQFEIKAAMELKKDYFIRAGFSANADIVLEKRDSVMVIPESVLKFEKENDSAYVEVETEPQKFEKRYIEVGLSDGINIEVLSGLTMEDKIKGEVKDDKKKKKEGEEA